MNEKLSGAYYTPFETVEFVYKYLIEQQKFPKTLLEPSMGDGRFIDRFMYDSNIDTIVGIELDDKKTFELSNKNYPAKISVVNSDFLLYAETCIDKFQLIIGNPPYINIRNMKKDFLEKAKFICKTLDLKDNLIKNAWVAFVLASVKLLDSRGVIFFVLPTEFLQVKYAEKLRGFIEGKFNTIHILSFNERMFPEIEQEACLVYLTNDEKGLPYISYRQYEKLSSDTYLFESRIERNKPLKKWSNAILSDHDIDFLRTAASAYDRIGDIAESAPGIVTAANNKFILTKDEVSKYKCNQYVIPVISKGAMVRNHFEINNELISRIANEGKRIYLLNLAQTVESELPAPLRKYLSDVAKIERNGVEIQKGYKCSKRKPWYAVPIVKSGSVVFFKRYDLCPRISTNPSNIHTTDIAYNLQLHEGIDSESLVFCFYNSLTIAQCEFEGRYYAGGVLELIPSEFQSLHIPYRHIELTDIRKLEEMFSKCESLEAIIEFVNSKTLALDLSVSEIKKLDSIRKQLLRRRR